MENNKKKNYKEVIRAIKFTIISISAGLIQIGTFALMYELMHWDYWVSYLISLLLSIVWNFTINRKITSKDDRHIRITQ